MLIEGVYLLSRFTVMAMRSEAPYIVYLLSGWGEFLIGGGSYLLCLRLSICGRISVDIHPRELHAW
jgi:hypothetical protein